MSRIIKTKLPGGNFFYVRKAVGGPEFVRSTEPARSADNLRSKLWSEFHFTWKKVDG